MPRIRKSQNSSTVKSRILWKVAVYIRLSKDDGNDESLSVTNQRKIIMEHLEHFFNDEHIIVDTYIDDGLTGTDYERPEFQRMIHDVETKKVNCIICKTLARAFRNYSDQGYFLEKVFPIHGLRFISIGDPSLDTFLNPEAVQGMEVPITGLMNDRYAARTSNDIRRTFNTKRRRGEFIGSFAPYGYKKDSENKNHLVIDQEAAQVVKDIFYWFVFEGMSKIGIAKHLNELGIPTPTTYKNSKGLKQKLPSSAKNDGLWNVSTIFNMLQNEMYIGTMVQGKYRIISYKVHDKIAQPKDEWFIVENTHEPIIDKQVFELAQSLGMRDTRTAPSERKVHLFSGFVRCADCNKSMCRKANKKKLADGTEVEYAYYACSTSLRKSKEKCANHLILERVLYETVLKVIQIQISLVANMAKLIEDINERPSVNNKSKRLNDMLMDKQRELDKIISVTDSLYMDWKCGEITKTEYTRMKIKFEEEAEQTRQAIKNIESEVQLSKQGIGVDNPYLTLFIKYKNIKTLDRGLLAELVDNIYVNNNKEITVKFNFEDQHKRILEFISSNKMN